MLASQQQRMDRHVDAGNHESHCQEIIMEGMGCFFFLYVILTLEVVERLMRLMMTMAMIRQVNIFVM